ncbi:MAG: phosphotransferase [Acidobacteria bacterium]|nr:phosphotransferase [Acidobacteriota bacterium]
MRVVETGRIVFPADAKAAREFAKRNLTSIHSRGRRLAAIGGNITLKGESREIAHSSPLSLIADESDIPDLADATLPPEDTEWLLLRDYEGGERARSTIFTFRDGRLSSVVKLRKRSSAGVPLANEARVLGRLQSSDDAVASKIPRVVEYGESGEHEILVLSPLEGQPLWISMQRSLRPLRSHRKHLVRAGAWLGRLHRETVGTSRGTLSDATEEAMALEKPPTERGVVVHGDLWARNLLFGNDGELSGVVDWERASLSGPLWHDLFTLPLLFAMNAPSWFPENPLDRFENAFARDSRASSVVGTYLEAYIREAGIDRALLRPMFEAFLAGGEKDAGKEEHGWRSQMPWTAMQARFRAAVRTVFSG